MSQVQILDYLAPVAQIARNCPTTTLVQAYLDAVREFCNTTHWLRTTITGVTDITPSAVTVYSLGSDTYNEIIGIHAASIDESSTVTTALTERSTGFDPQLAAAVPEFYRYLPHGNFEVSPPPDAVYNLTISAIIQPKRGQAGIDETLVLNWEYVFRAGALAYLLRIPGQPWTDKAEANVQMALFREGIVKGCWDEQTGYNSGAATTDRPGGANGRLRSRILAI